ncbi:MAG: hypothetical protein ACTHOC_07610 [Luteimonas sp.]
MKIALDEHISKSLVEALTALSGEAGMLQVELVSARNYAVPKATSDVPWLQKFKADGGTVVVSGDAKMRGKLHEQRALSDAGFVVFFPARRWNQLNGLAKTAFLILWWQAILQTAASAKPGQFFEVPLTNRVGPMRVVTPPERKKPGRKKKAQ